MRFSIVGFLVGALCAIVLYVVGTDLLDDEIGYASLIFGVMAVLLWAFLTTHWDRVRR